MWRLMMASVRKAVVFRIFPQACETKPRRGQVLDGTRSEMGVGGSGESHARPSHVMARRCVSWRVVIVSPVARPDNDRKTSSSPSAMKLKLICVSRDDHDEARLLPSCRQPVRGWANGDKVPYRWKSFKVNFNCARPCSCCSATNNTPTTSAHCASCPWPVLRDGQHVTDASAGHIWQSTSASRSFTSAEAAFTRIPRHLQPTESMFMLLGQ